MKYTFKYLLGFVLLGIYTQSVHAGGGIEQIIEQLNDVTQSVILRVSEGNLEDIQRLDVRFRTSLVNDNFDQFKKMCRTEQANLNALNSGYRLSINMINMNVISYIRDGRNYAWNLIAPKENRYIDEYVAAQNQVRALRAEQEAQRAARQREAVIEDTEQSGEYVDAVDTGAGVAFIAHQNAQANRDTGSSARSLIGTSSAQDAESSNEYFNAVSSQRFARNTSSNNPAYNFAQMNVPVVDKRAMQSTQAGTAYHMPRTSHTPEPSQQVISSPSPLKRIALAVGVGALMYYCTKKLYHWWYQKPQAEKEDKADTITE